MTEHIYTAVLDRFEEESAVLLLEREGEVVDETVVPRAMLPEAGRHRDAVFGVSLADEESMEFRYDPDRTRERRDAAQSRFDRLSRRLGDEESDSDEG
ncbi:DUF3006 domain-containing protein [Halopelagius fulvigenes]|uniref:DUF3006 domain-containing protein n=1 Tax=Halopelagius fulvigenes TaxID=1198324 RepID=A0ABD5TYA9_9EURY